MKLDFTKLLKVVAFSVVCLLFTVALGVKLANSRLFADTYSLEAEFANAQGVLPNDAVKLAGVDVGRVEKAEIEDGRAILTFNVDKSVNLPKDSTVSIRWRNVVGQRFLYVFPGTTDELLEDGDRVPMEQTESIADIGEFVNRAGPILKAIDPRDANAFLDAINEALTGNEATVRNLIDNGAHLASELAAKDDDIASLIDSSDEVLHAFASQDDQIKSIIDDLDSVGEVLARRTDEINSVVTNFAVVQQQLNEVVTENRADIDGSIENLDAVARILASSRKDLKRTLRTLPLGVAGYFQTTSWGEWFNVRIIELVVRDTQSNDIARQGELDNQHGDEGGDPGGNGGGGGGGGGRPEGADERQGVEAILRYVLTGEGDA